MSPSSDGGTYLAFEEYDGGACDASSLQVDGVRWALPLDSIGVIRPGQHVILCDRELTIRVDSGTVFRFNYWGP